jgi:hypothetical protein
VHEAWAFFVPVMGPMIEVAYGSRSAFAFESLHRRLEPDRKPSESAILAEIQ